MLDITKKISNYNFSGRNGQSIKYIVMHFTGNQNDTTLGNANYFGGANRDASAHYFIDDNSIVQVVEDHNASWNCGDGNGKYGITNQNSIAIEMCATDGDISAITESNTMELVKYLMAKYSITADRVVRHYDASHKVCPSPWSANNWNKWNEFKSKLSGNGNINTIAPETQPTLSKKKIDSFIKVDNFSWVKNLEDFAGWLGTPVKNLYAYPSQGEILFRVSPVNRDYYSWVQNYKSSNGNYDFAGNGIPIDRVQMKLKGLNGYSIRYRVHLLGGSWLEWVNNDTDFAGIVGRTIDAIEVEII